MRRIEEARILWRPALISLAAEPVHLGQGYMAEAANAAPMDGFVRLRMKRVVSIMARRNVRSQGLMERIGMTRMPERGFDHSALPDGP